MHSRIRLALPALLFVAGTATAQNRDIGDVAEGIAGQFTQLISFVGSLVMVIGVIFAVVSFLKFRAYTANPSDPQNTIKGAIGYLVAGAACLALPEMLNIGVSSLLGTAQTSSVLEGSTLLGN